MNDRDADRLWQALAESKEWQESMSQTINELALNTMRVTLTHTAKLESLSEKIKDINVESGDIKKEQKRLTMLSYKAIGAIGILTPIIVFGMKLF